MREPNSNDATVQFYSRVQERCERIASLPPLEHDAEIRRLSDETGLSPITLIPMVERYSYQRILDCPALAAKFIEKIGREKVRAMLSTGYGQRELTRYVQIVLETERLSLTGPRLGLLIDAIRSQFQPAPPSELIVGGAPSRR